MRGKERDRRGTEEKGKWRERGRLRSSKTSLDYALMGTEPGICSYLS